MDDRRIDVHHHFVPSFYREAVESVGGDPSGWVVPDWSPEEDAAVNDKFGIKTAILSLTAPGACILKDPKASAELARKANEYAAKLRDEKPNQYGFFAALPNILDKEYALREIAYAYDVLRADGVTLFTRYGDGNHYLGHPDFRDIWAELNRRSAIVQVHPTHPVDTAQVSGLPQPVIRYPFETTQAAIDMLYQKTVRNNPACKIILSHAGGALPYLISRPASTLPQEEYDAFWDDARSFYFDTALSGTDNVFRTLESFAKPGHILYGSDAPYAPDDLIKFHTSRQDQYLWDNSNLRADINRKSALLLFPRLK
ncbi:putative amidohydrolase family protein [Aspergillus bombycis]|uniref:6-methylsalicylate decarboxylase n=1 Tax=Aspergillus bombycis TaxID=109264 RepID=A0A1F8A8E9_9EURO|nr:putative amidohydrolase family protein [Aspergillus bombycis]OGM47699.1 putative amidohydrolase family protein [Aspergillus bombycis]